ncbi:WbqC family protein [candidate division KSB1 bacterium]
MIVAVQYPEFLPGLAYFDRLFNADLHIILDSVGMPKRSGICRTVILGRRGTTRLSVPVLRSGRRDQLIRDTHIDNSGNWKKKLLDRLYHHYCGSPFFEDIYPLVKAIISRPHSRIADMNIELIKKVAGVMQLPENHVRSSELEITGSGSEYLVKLIRTVGGDVFLAADETRSFLSEHEFSRNGISIRRHSFEHPPYDQYSGKFYPDLSVFDTLSHCTRQRVYSFFAPAAR